MKKLRLNSKVGSTSPPNASLFSLLVCISNVQTILNTISNRWIFSIAINDGNKSNASYLNIRVRVNHNGVWFNMHLLTSPMRQQHTVFYMFELISKILDNRVPAWTERLLSKSINGASKMTGHYQSVNSHSANAALPRIYRIWCPSHLLDWVLQKA